MNADHPQLNTPSISVGLPVWNITSEVADWLSWHQKLGAQREGMIGASSDRGLVRLVDSVIGLFEDLLVNCADGLEESSDKRMVDPIAIRAGAVRRTWSDMERGYGEAELVALKKALKNLLLEIARKRESESIDQGGLVLQECGVPFYSEVGTSCEREGSFLEFTSAIPSTNNLRQLYIRECYDVIASTILRESKSSRQKFIITGTPGIGKSIFLFYLAHRLVREKNRVLLIYNPVKVYYDTEGRVSKVGNLPDTDDLGFWSKSLWCLFDARGVTASDLHQIPYDQCTFVLSTSPKRDLVNDFKKSMNPRIFYMPIWTEGELDAIANVLGDVPNEWREKFKHIGGVPRYVFDMDVDVHRSLDQACNQCTLDDCIKMVGFDAVISDHCKSAIHRLIHITSLPPFTDSSVDFASKTVARAVFRSKRIESLAQIRSWLESSFRIGGCLNGFMGTIFEQYAIEMLEKGGSFDCRELISGRQKRQKPSTFKLDVTASSKVIVDTVEQGQQNNVLHVPTTANYTAIDAWIPSVGAFQMTVSEFHPIKGDIESQLRDIGPGDGRLYWVLPPWNYDSFTMKTPQTINQYAIRMPYPQVFQVDGRT